jgi:hypothetical protein
LDLRINTLKLSANQLHLFQGWSRIEKGVKYGSAAETAAHKGILELIKETNLPQVPPAKNICLPTMVP